MYSATIMVRLAYPQVRIELAMTAGIEAFWKPFYVLK